MPASKASKKTSFVPRAVFRVAVTGAGVIPLCVTAGLASVQGCGNTGLSVAEICYADGARCPVGVALACFGDGPNKCPPAMGVADATFRDVKVDHEGGVLPERLGVADATFKDVNPDQDAGMDVLFGVADIAFKG